MPNFIYDIAIKSFLKSIEKEPLVIKYPEYNVEVYIQAKKTKKKGR